MIRLILASSSPRRIRLLRAAKFNPEVISPDVEELSCEFLTPSELTLFNAYQKASAVALRYPDAVVLAADTVVTLESQIFGKPRDLDDAHRMLGILVGKTHDVITGIALLEPTMGRITLRVERSAVTFRPLPAAEIDEYLKRVNPLDKAGAYAAQNSADIIIERISGSFTNVVGLPMELVRPLLQTLGVHPSAKTDPLSSR